jgi:hypothetical protein
MGDYQDRFGDGRYVIDNIFVLKIINKKIWEYNQNLRYLFIDFQKAYDSIHTMAWSHRKNAGHSNPQKDVVRKAVCNKTQRKTKNEMAGWCVYGPEKDGNK